MRISSPSRLACVALCLIGSLLLGACATPPQRVRADVTAFSQWPTNGTDGATYAFERTPGQADSLEHRAYEALVAEQLDRFALRPARAGQPARFTVALSYSIAKQDVSTLVTDWPEPPMTTWGFMGYTRYGRPVYGWRPYAYGGYWGAPWGAGPVTREVRETLWRRELKLDLREGAGKVWEGTATSDGRTDNFSAIAPYLVRALFEEFPGASGKVRRVEIPIEAQPAGPLPPAAAPAAAPPAAPAR
ncbi:DUF4136 domain-containing protein [Derxia lacustris]|uniref:DUF4136 domain-containing protein n=1 Tax=Derxia lacustris TaxID=764842 RepID=UPI000A173B18|nr:DUF4136 domain-containing protein [Derxia lacustris]